MFPSTLRGSEPFFYSTITPLDWKVAMVAVRDIGRSIADDLVRAAPRATSPYTYELHGPQAYSPLDVHAAFTEVLGPSVAMRPVEKHELHDFYGKLFPPQIVDDWVEMALSFQPGGIAEAEISRGGAGGAEVVRGKTGLFEAIKEALAAAGLSGPA
jgi:uncharacterized protein YbjT (DUF2867 family)